MNIKKAVNIAEKNVDFNEEQKGQGLPSGLATQLKIVSPKKLLQRLSIALAQVKAGNTTENLINEIKQVIYLLYRAKKNYKKNI